ncbi:TM2 domain-containing protein [Antrihabitans sp. YC2-6]|uniref:TM2 domain-containing protein n=1 Tax=Antrihabitans sp. YC2-6 TaxID=2799498 RepID=UPI0018F5B61C|nr:TM2 domain-containing protein [Antrihabitans sp. YC2-6]MBJ8344552.1 TM2 domain-containing protein [Antrihabitans sp. YC2-6]
MAETSLPQTADILAISSSVTYNDQPEYKPNGGQQPPQYGQQPPPQYGQQPPQYGQQPPPYGQPAYGAPSPYGAPDPTAPYGRHPVTGQPLSDKQKLVAGLLQLFLGGFGAGRWYLGYNGVAIAQLLTCGGLGVWALIDCILIFIGKVPDPQGRPLRD